MTDPIFLKNARFVLSMDEGKIYENTNIRIEEGSISRIGELDSSRGDEIIDCSGSIVMPGIVNSHTHAAMVLLRGLNDDAPLQEWLESMWAVETKFKPKIEQMGAEMGFLEMIRTGTTACIDMYGADTAAAAASSVGIRLGAGVPLISIFGKTEDRLAAGRKFIDEHRDYDRVIPMVNLHSIYTNDEEAMVKAGELSREKDVLLNVHCSETRKEVFENKRDHGRLA
ncbi:MAG: amidohydrolase family protein, partial [Candidatus Thermoplasmatota archaeon]|nr:amidohydrolase family protein [Candidatus Thermoplasmatota archaeon]